MPRLKSAQRSKQRMKQNVTHGKSKEYTPQKFTDVQMLDANLSAVQKDKLKIPLLLGHVIQ